MDGRLTGKIRVLKHGYGFIRVYPKDNPRKNYFFHKENLENVNFYSLEEGDVMSFEPCEDEKGPMAIRVRIEIENHLCKGDDQLCLLTKTNIG